MSNQDTAPVFDTNTTINLNNVHFFRPVAGKTLREQLVGKKLAEQEVVDYLREHIGEITLPSHWEGEWRELRKRSEYYLTHDFTCVTAFSMTYLAPRWPNDGDERWPKGNNENQVHGFCWDIQHRHPWASHHVRHYLPEVINPLDLMVGNGWDEEDWILIEEDMPVE